MAGQADPGFVLAQVALPSFGMWAHPARDAADLMALDAVGAHPLVVAGRAPEDIPPGVPAVIVLPSRRMGIGG